MKKISKCFLVGAMLASTMLVGDMTSAKAADIIDLSSAETVDVIEVTAENDTEDSGVCYRPKECQDNENEKDKDKDTTAVRRIYERLTDIVYSGTYWGE